MVAFQMDVTSPRGRRQRQTCGRGQRVQRLVDLAPGGHAAVARDLRRLVQLPGLQLVGLRPDFRGVHDLGNELRVHPLVAVALKDADRVLEVRQGTDGKQVLPEVPVQELLPEQRVDELRDRVLVVIVPEGVEEGFHQGAGRRRRGKDRKGPQQLPALGFPAVAASPVHLLDAHCRVEQHVVGKRRLAHEGRGELGERRLAPHHVAARHGAVHDLRRIDHLAEPLRRLLQKRLPGVPLGLLLQLAGRPDDGPRRGVAQFCKGHGLLHDLLLDARCVLDLFPDTASDVRVVETQGLPERDAAVLQHLAGQPLRLPRKTLPEAFRRALGAFFRARVRYFGEMTFAALT